MTEDMIALRKIHENRVKISQMFAPFKKDVQRILPSVMTAEKMFQLMVDLFARNPKLMQCTPQSIVGALFQCALLRLDPAPLLGLVALIPRDNKKKGVTECHMELQYKGLLALARRHPEIKNIYAVNVYDKDVFKVIQGLPGRRNIIHEESQEEGRDKITHSYAVVEYTNGAVDFLVMSAKEIIKVRDLYSKSYWKEHSPWKSRPSKMFLKTVLKGLMSSIPLAGDFLPAIVADEQVLTPDNFLKGTAEKGINVNTFPSFEEQMVDLKEQKALEGVDTEGTEPAPTIETETSLPEQPEEPEKPEENKEEIDKAARKQLAKILVEKYAETDIVKSYFQIVTGKDKSAEMTAEDIEPLLKSIDEKGLYKVFYDKMTALAEDDSFVEIWETHQNVIESICQADNKLDDYQILIKSYMLLKGIKPKKTRKKRTTKPTTKNKEEEAK